MFNNLNIIFFPSLVTMKYLPALLFLGLLAVSLIPHSEGAPMEEMMRSKRSPQDAGEEVEATTPVWCNPSNPFRFVNHAHSKIIIYCAFQVQSEGGCQVQGVGRSKEVENGMRFCWNKFVHLLSFNFIFLLHCYCS